jgi:23S rRNA-intervening sequence protein
MAFQSFEDLEVWQRGCRLAVDVFKTYWACHNFTMQDQVQPAALSIPSNVAEGSGGELRTQLYISRKLDFVSESDFDRLVKESKEISAMLHGLSCAVGKRIAKKTPRSIAPRPES